MTALQPADLTQRSAEQLAAAGWAPAPLMFPGGPVVVARYSQFRWSWLATRMHTFVVLAEFTQTQVGLPVLDRLMDDAVDYAIQAKGGLPRGLQTGVAVVTVAIGNGWTAEREWAAHPRRRRFAAMTMPVIADLADGQVIRPQRALMGAIYQPYLRSVVDTFVQQPMAQLRP